MIGDSLLQPSNCLLAIFQAEVEQRAPVWVHRTMPTEFFQFSQHSRGRILFPDRALAATSSTRAPRLLSVNCCAFVYSAIAAGKSPFSCKAMPRLRCA